MRYSPNFSKSLNGFRCYLIFTTTILNFNVVTYGLGPKDLLFDDNESDGYELECPYEFMSNIFDLLVKGEKLV